TIEVTKIDNIGTPRISKQSVSLSNPSDPFSIVELNIHRRVKDSSFTSVYDGSNKKWVNTSAEGRVSSVTINNSESIVESQVGGYIPSQFTYDTSGRLTAIIQGARKTRLEYGTNGFLTGITNPLGQRKSFVNDASGRVLTEMSHDGRETHFEYDINGNLISLTPPSRPKHSFLLNTFEEVLEYLPPFIGGTNKTRYIYNIDNQLQKVLRPDGAMVQYHYLDGRPHVIQAGDTYFFNYSPIYDNYTQVAHSSGITSDFEFHGPHIKKETQTIASADPVSIEHRFDDEHRVVSSIVRGATTHSAVSRVYDKDGFLIYNGWAAYQRNDPMGRVTRMTVDNIEARFTYDSNYGELSKIEYRQGSKILYSVNYERDPLGRIVHERKGPFGYAFVYDDAGRLMGRKEYGDPTWLTRYHYDQNGNRIRVEGPEAPAELSEYDDQDRILNNGAGISFVHNESGERTQREDVYNVQSTYYSY
ncbi:MAG TPA: hypothetical protein PKC28_12965, partial [Bdellovibrionales bacterium]|nr:hypothetical protein [Bdellovibrionales bacterium]